MKVLIVGSGGREHALAWKVSLSPKVKKVYCAPGNAGMASLGECVDIDAMDIPAIVEFARKKDITLAIIGPEAPCIAGLADELRKAGIPTFGPSARAAIIEGSKVFSKELMHKYGIPTAWFRIFDDPARASDFIEEFSCGDRCSIVVKADGEALGKGVFVCDTREEALGAVRTIMVDRAFGRAGDRVVIEERLKGQEVSLVVITDGRNVVPLTPVQDYKRALDGDLGLNTGGMGCYTPVPVMTPELYKEVIENIIKPTVKAMEDEDRFYTGALYTGVILTDEGPKVLEYNARFGDPETQVTMPMLEADLVEVIQAALTGTLDSVDAKCYNGAAVCVVAASGGYPGSYEKGKPISGLDEAGKLENVTVFHAGTKLADGRVVTSGGRVLGITARGHSYKAAIKSAYEAAAKISFDGMFYRKDIGARVL